MAKSAKTWREYEQRKAQLQRSGLSAAEYQKALAALAKKLGL